MLSGINSLAVDLSRLYYVYVSSCCTYLPTTVRVSSFQIITPLQQVYYVPNLSSCSLNILIVMCDFLKSNHKVWVDGQN